MPQIIDLQLFQAARATTQPVWAELQGKFEQSQELFNQGITAQQETSSALGGALAPIFSAAGSVISGGIQNVMGGGSFFPQGSPLGAAAQPAMTPWRPQIAGQGGVMGPPSSFAQ